MSKMYESCEIGVQSLPRYFSLSVNEVVVQIMGA